MNKWRVLWMSLDDHRLHMPDEALVFLRKTAQMPELDGGMHINFLRSAMKLVAVAIVSIVHLFTIS
jgi:hypothetical protein